MSKRDLQTIRAALRSSLAPQSEYRRQKLDPEKHPVKSRSSQEIDQEIRTLNKLWNRFKKAGGEKL